MVNNFEEFYRDAIASLVEEAEAKARKLRRTRQPLALAIAAVWLFASGAGIYALPKPQPLPVLIGLSVFAVVGGLILWGAIRYTGSQTYAKGFAEKIATLLTQKGFNGTFIADPDRDHVDYRTYGEASGLKKLIGARPIYGLSGCWNNRSFRLVHAKSSSAGNYSSSERQSGGEYHTVYFNGVILEVDLPGSSPTIVIRERAWIKDIASKFLGQDRFVEITVDDEVFDAKYQVTTDDPENAASWITPDFAQAMMSLEGDPFSSPVTLHAAFLGGKLFLSVTRPGKNIMSDLEPSPSYEKTVSYERRAKEASEELGLACTILDRLPLARR